MTKELLQEIIEDSDLLKDFIRYVRVDTQSDPESDTFPSSEKEKDLGRMLEKELRELELENVEMDENGYVYGHIPANNDSDTKVGFIAHMDVAPDCPGNGVKPNIIENYDGSDIKLEGTEITVKNSPQLKECVGDTIITSDGTTLLGADDKAGVAEIMTLIKYLRKNPEIKHPAIRICFTPDEEIGKGVDKINLEKVDADFAYTLDGGYPTEMNYENFNAFSCEVTFKGVSIHPGYAKDRLVNAMRYAGKFLDRLPADMAPETTEKREPFIHPISVSGGSDKTVVKLILRGFEMEEIEKEKQIVKNITNEIASKVKGLDIDLSFEKSYLNMFCQFKDKMFIVEYMKESLKELGENPVIKPIRGGTDGSRLSFMGLPCPNIFAGGVNFHSREEWVSLQKMALSAALIITMVQNID